jgi:hypothetical protein
MEKDAIQVQQAIQSKSWELSAMGGLIKEFQEIAQLNCVEFRISAVPVMELPTL